MHICTRYEALIVVQFLMLFQVKWRETMNIARK